MLIVYLLYSKNIKVMLPNLMMSFELLKFFHPQCYFLALCFF